MTPGDLVLCIDESRIHNPLLKVYEGVIYMIADERDTVLDWLVLEGKPPGFSYPPEIFRPIPKPSIAALETVRRDTVWAKLERDARRIMRKATGR